MSELRIGTCSWKYPSWHGLVYSAPKGINYLEEYARKYNTVEIDQWFWSLFGDSVRLPRPADVESYRRAVPDTFRFSVKIPNSVTLTHHYRKQKGDPLVENPHFLSQSLFARFLSLLDPMKDVLGPLILQFEYLNKQKMPSQKQFQELMGGFVSSLPGGYEYGLEIRNTNYLNDSFFEFVRKARLTPVLLQGYYMPSIMEIFDRWRPVLFEHDTVVIRLHGPDRKEIEKTTGGKWDAIVAPKDDELKGVVSMTSALLEHGVDVYVNANNHYEGSAPQTIERILRLL